MTKAPWNEGNAERGKRSTRRRLQRLPCGSGLGPDLKGVAVTVLSGRSLPIDRRSEQGRLRPLPHDASAHEVGRRQVGLVVYEAADGLMLQTAPATMVRIPDERDRGATAAAHVDHADRTSRIAHPIANWRIS